MEVTNRAVIVAVIPVFLTVFGGLVDKGIQWRSEMEQKKYDRQTRLIDKIMEIPKADERLAMANFYLSIGVFDGAYKVELDKAIEQAKTELVAVAAPAPEEVSESVVASIAPLEYPSEEAADTSAGAPVEEVDWAQVMKDIQRTQTLSPTRPTGQELINPQRQEIPSVFSFDR